jgi:negative regulator of sigma E activity
MAVNEHMTDALNEQLSACLDGELPPAELDLLLKRLERDPDLRETLGRYSAVGEALRNAKPAVASRSFADKVMAVVFAPCGPLPELA